MKPLLLATITFNKPRLLEEQIRLLGENLRDHWELWVFDASTNDDAADEMLDICTGEGVEYRKLLTHLHHEALNVASGKFIEWGGWDYMGFLDHDIFPIRPTTLIDKIEEAGFYGVGQRHPATGHLYLWPGFCFFSREWLAGRPLDFSGYRDGDRRNDGDTGSNLWPLFVEEDWDKLFRAHHAHRFVREPDEYGLQSFGYEEIGDWLHMTNGSGWMRVPRAEERERLLFDLLAKI